MLTACFCRGDGIHARSVPFVPSLSFQADQEGALRGKTEGERSGATRLDEGTAQQSIRNIYLIISIKAGVWPGVVGL